MIEERDEEAIQRVFLRYRRTGSVALRNELVFEYMDLASAMAHRFRNRGEPMEDLEQVARFGLIRAVERFDPERGVPFPGFAIPTILGELKRYFRDRTWSGSVRRSVKELVPRVRSAMEDLEFELGRSPRPAEVAEHLGMSVEDVIEALEAVRWYKARSLSTPVREGGESLGSMIASSENQMDAATTRMLVSSLVSQLDERKQKIIHGRFVDELSQDEIAARLGISQMHVSRLLRAALQELAEMSDSNGSDGTNVPSA